ncbi:MAG: hypothetical protein HQK77_22290 [Desulfobacterales bacterium]|nr:hypothetical protein [Desulfobacterales bacterium]
MDKKQIEEKEKEKRYEHSLEMNRKRQIRYSKYQEERGKKMFRVWLSNETINRIEQKKGEQTWEQFFENILSKI